MSEPMKRPNIVFILTDDQGYWSLGCYGNKEIKTPNLDRLAKSGMRFDNFYCASPVCSPARASIFTGHIPSRHGVRDWIHSGHVDESQLDEELLKQIYNPDSPKEYQQAKGQLKGDAAIDYIAGETCYTDYWQKPVILAAFPEMALGGQRTSSGRFFLLENHCHGR